MALGAPLRRITLLTLSSWYSLKYSTAYLFTKYSNNKAILLIPKRMETFKQYSHNGEIPIAQYEEIKELPKHPEKLFIDVREASELKETGHIPTSINIPLGELEKELSPQTNEKEFKDKYGRNKPKLDTEIIFSCKLGGRAQKAAQMAKNLGFINIKNFKGSWKEWAEKEGISK